MTKTIIIFGASGLVGQELNHVFKAGNVITPSSKECDITDSATVQAFIKKNNPQLIINSAGVSNVDWAEENPETTNSVNSSGVLFIAEAAAKYSAYLIHYSTDYVFDGQKKVPYMEDDPVNPLSE